VAPQSLVYVHGAGPQKPAADLKQELDVLLFGQDMATTRVAHYSNVRWPPTTGAGLAVGQARTGRTRRARAIRVASQPQVSPKAAAAAIVAATLEAPTGRRGRGAAAATSTIGAPGAAEARRLAEQLYRRADRIAARSSQPAPGLALGPSFPDPIFRFIVGRFASDVIDYLYGPHTQQMRGPVRQALLGNPPPGVIVAHSLGTIILYDVLSEPAFAGLSVPLLVTLGSPLGIGNVQNRLRDSAGRPNPVPTSLRAWSNFADRWDPVALDATLRNEFDPPRDFATDESVNNPADNNHDLTGYLSIGIVRSTIVSALGQLP